MRLAVNIYINWDKWLAGLPRNKGNAGKLASLLCFVASGRLAALLECKLRFWLRLVFLRRTIT
jgi:hypothetical protein